MNTDNDMYNIANYSDADLYNMLDVSDPSDRELEAKILLTIDKYSEIEGASSKRIKEFFDDVYEHFFGEETYHNNNTQIQESYKEGMEATQHDNELLSEQETKSHTKNPTLVAPPLIHTTDLQYGSSAINPLLKETQKRVLHLDSQFRNYDNYPNSTDYLVNLSEGLDNIVSLRLHSISIPYTWYNLSNVYNANYFYIKGVSAGVKDVFNIKFEITAGAYNVTELVDTLNECIVRVASENPTINFGTTKVTYDTYTSKLTFILDMQQVFTETNYFLYFDYLTNAFDDDVRKDSIGGFLGFGNINIPRYTSNSDLSGAVSVPNIYLLNSIYSDFNYSYNATSAITPVGIQPIVTNYFNPNDVFSLVIDEPDATPVIQGNNYFTIIVYNGPGPYIPSTSTVYETIKITFAHTSGNYTRDTLLEAINRALSESPYLTSNSSMSIFDVDYTITGGDTVTMQRFQLQYQIDSGALTVHKDMKQTVIFPDESTFTTPITPKLWTGISSCFMFNPNKTNTNTILAETPPVITKYNIDSIPQMTIRCTKSLYDNTFNNRSITIPTSSASGYPDGYSMNDYVGITTIGAQHKSSIINSEFATVASVITNGHLDVDAFFSIGDQRIHIKIDIETYFDQTDYILDMSGCFLNISFGSAATINIADATLNTFTGAIPALSFPFTIDNTNDKIVVTPKVGQGNSSVPPYTINFIHGTYRTHQLLQHMVNNVFASIQGETDSSNTPLNGLNMVQSKIELSATEWKFIYIINNRITQNDYECVFTDDKNTYQNEWIDADGNTRLSVDSSGNVVTSSAPPVTGTSWNALLGFTETTYELFGLNGTEFVSEMPVMTDTSSIIVINSTNNAFYFIPQDNIVGLSDADNTYQTGVFLADGIYSIYNLYNAINNALSANTTTNGSVIYSYFDSTGTEYALLQININKLFTAADYELEFFDHQNEIPSTDENTVTWDVTLGWLLGFRDSPQYILNSSYINNARYVQNNAYTFDSNTGIVQMTGDTCLDLYLFKNLYLIIDDYTQNHLNDGLVTGIRQNPYATEPSYSSKATRTCAPNTVTNQTSIFNAIQPGMGLTENQLFAANIIAQENTIKHATKLYSDPPYVKDMFALIPVKVSGLKQGDLFTEYGGTLQDNTRSYFGPVNITKMRIRLLNDHGDVIDLNGSNWSFSLIFEYLYNKKGI